jgi:hypothetical protein
LIEVDVSEYVKGDIVSYSRNVSFNVVKFSTEFSNTGSIAYKARARIFVYKDDKLAFTGWSQEKTLMPGSRKTFDIYWYSNSPMKYKAKLRLYFGNEIIESEEKEFQIDKILVPEDTFEIMNFRTYDDYVIFDIKSKKDAKDVMVIPSNYPLGWIFEQKTIDFIRKDSMKTVLINYYPTVWEPKSLKLMIVGENGNCYMEKTLEMKKEEGIIKLFYDVLDSLRSFFL